MSKQHSNPKLHSRLMPCCSYASPMARNKLVSSFETVSARKPQEWQGEALTSQETYNEHLLFCSCSPWLPSCLHFEACLAQTRIGSSPQPRQRSPPLISFSGTPTAKPSHIQITRPPAPFTISSKVLASVMSCTAILSEAGNLEPELMLLLALRTKP